MKHFIQTLLFLSISIHLIAQTTVKYIDPKATFEQANELYSKGENLNALELLQSINENDSIFKSAILIKADILMEEERYKELVELCDKYIYIHEESYFSLNLKKGIALYLSEKFNESIKVYTDLLVKYPKNYLLKYNLGVAYEQVNKFKEAIKCYKEAILYNPYYASAHLNLGNLCFEENKLSQALLCWDTYLMLNPNGNKSLQVLIFADKAVSKKAESTPKGIAISSDDETFNQMDKILNSQMALDDNYEIPIKVDVPFVKQNYALMEMVKSYSAKGGFWSDKYIAMFKKILAENNFELLMYRAISSVDNKSYQKQINKEEKRIKEFVTWYAKEWILIIGSDNNPLKPEDQYFYNSKGILASIGTRIAEGDNFSKIVYYKNGRLLSSGEMINGNRTGHWQWFYESGTIKEEVDYDSIGEPNGPYIKYYTNGNIKTETTLIGKDYQGETKNYSKYGYLTELAYYKDDYYDSIKILYHPLGKDFVRLSIPYTMGIINGKVQRYFPKGNIAMEVEFIDDERVEIEKQYHYNGILSSIYNYKNGKLNGEYKGYYFSGNLYQTGIYEAEELNGSFISYYETGDTNEHTHYLNGELHGKYIHYNRDGSVNNEFNYNTGKVTDYSYYNSKGEILSNANNLSGSYLYEGYYPNGKIRSTGNYNNDRKRTGLWKYYSLYGALISKEVFIDGEITDNDTSYYSNGAIADITPYKNGETNGLYTSYYINGTLKQEGFYKDGNAERIWKNYYPDGTLKNELYFENDILKGYQYNYTGNGKLYSIDYNENKFLIYQTIFDTSGVALDTINYFTETKLELDFPNGKKRAVYNSINGNRHGQYVSYYINDQIRVSGNYFMGQQDGNWKWYNDRGQLTCDGNYENGKLVGEWLYYYDNGKISNRKNYKYGKLHGTYLAYNKAGKLEYEVEYFEDMKNGEAKYYCPQGNLQMVRYYTYDELIGYSYPDADNNIKLMITIESGNGEIVTYFQNGFKGREFKLINGEFNGMYNSYYNNGQLESTNEYLAGERIGKQINYYLDGQILNEVSYLNDVKHGEYLSYYKNGILEKKLTYKNDKLAGKGEYFNEDGSLYKEEWYFNDEIYSAKYY